MNVQRSENPPKIGVAVVVVKDGKILLGKDMGKGGVFGVPGGHWESGEALKDCGIRETKEESGIVCKGLKLISVHDFYREDKGRSYATIGFKAEYGSGELVDEQDKRMEWGWYDPKDALNLDLFPPDRILIERYLSGIIYV